MIITSILMQTREMEKSSMLGKVVETECYGTYGLLCLRRNPLRMIR